MPHASAFMIIFGLLCGAASLGSSASAAGGPMFSALDAAPSSAEAVRWRRHARSGCSVRLRRFWLGESWAYEKVKFCYHPGHGGMW